MTPKSYFIESLPLHTPIGSRVHFKDWDREGSEDIESYGQSGVFTADLGYATYLIVDDDGEEHTILDSWEVLFEASYEQVLEVVENLGSGAPICIEGVIVWGDHKNPRTWVCNDDDRGYDTSAEPSGTDPRFETSNEVMRFVHKFLDDLS